jgi:hypothetical protein
MAFPDENGSYNNTLDRQIPRKKSRKPTAALADYEIRNLCRGSLKLYPPNTNPILKQRRDFASSLSGDSQKRLPEVTRWRSKIQLMR